MKASIRYDDSLPVFSDLVRRTWGDDSLRGNVFLRDVSGKLTFVVLDTSHSSEERARMAAVAEEELGVYVDGGGFAVSTPEELFDDSLKDRKGALAVRLDHPRFKGSVSLVDRRMVGADWLRAPMPSTSAPTRIVFASLKGGVGRSTALCVLAAHLAAHGRRVLAIDMDLESPGLGNMLLASDTLPEFGLLDYFAESEVGGELNEQFLVDMVGPSWLGGGHGRVDVIPAIGKRSLIYPENVLGKIARAYLGGSPVNGDSKGFSDHMRILVEQFANPRLYEAILIDARAGLHETTAAAMTGLGAEVLLFGLDEPQTFAGFELLFASISTLPAGSVSNWLSHLHVVHAKAPADQRRRAGFLQRVETILDKYSTRGAAASTNIDPLDLADTFEVEWSDSNASAVEAILLAEDAAPSMAVILDSDQFRSFDPVVERDVLSEAVYLAPFRDLIDLVTEAFKPFEQPAQGSESSD